MSPSLVVQLSGNSEYVGLKAGYVDGIRDFALFSQGNVDEVPSNGPQMFSQGSFGVGL
jgi:hypothetical protein